MTTTSGSVGFDCGENIDTRANILTLRNTGALEPGCLYTANDINWVVAGGANGHFTALAIDADTLATHGYYESDLTNPGEPWEASIDWDTGRVYYMKDAHLRENEVHGDLEVSRFPWDEPNVTRTEIRYSNFLYTGGRVDNITVANNSDVRVSNGTLTDADVMSSGIIRLESNSTITDVSVNSNGRLYALVDGAFVDDITVSDETTLQLTGPARVEHAVYNSNSIIYLDGGSHNRFNVGNTSYIDARGWQGNFRQVDVSRYDIRITGTGTFSESDLKGLGYVRLRDVVGVNVYDLHSDGYGYLIADRSDTFRLRYTGFDGIGYIYGNDSVNTTVERCDLDTNGIINVNSANGLVVYRCKANQSGNIVATLGASGRLDAVEASKVCTIRLDGTTGLDFDQVNFNTGCYVDIRNAVAPLIREFTLKSNATLYASGSTSMRIRYGEATRTNMYVRNSTRVYIENPSLQTGYFDFDGATDNVINYLSYMAYGYVRGENAPQGRIDRVAVIAYGLLRIQGNVAPGWAVSDTEIKSRADVRVESSGAIRESTFASRAIFTARHTGNIRRAFVIQRVHTQTTPVNDLRLHQGGTF